MKRGNGTAYHQKPAATVCYGVGSNVCALPRPPVRLAWRAEPVSVSCRVPARKPKNVDVGLAPERAGRNAARCQKERGRHGFLDIGAAEALARSCGRVHGCAYLSGGS